MASSEAVGTAATLDHVALVAQTVGLLRLAQATAVLALVLAAAAFAFWLLKRLHGGAADDTLATHDSLTNFRELHARGGLSDEEFRTIKTKLARELDAGLGDSAEGNQLQE